MFIEMLELRRCTLHLGLVGIRLRSACHAEGRCATRGSLLWTTGTSRSGKAGLNPQGGSRLHAEPGSPLDAD